MTAARERERQALELRRAGLTFDVIAERLNYANRSSARRAYERALERAEGTTEPAAVRMLEVDRLDRLLTGVWAKAAKGDLAAVDRVLKISERRDRVVAHATKNTHQLREAFTTAVESNPTVNEELDAALIGAGRQIADRIDAAVAIGDDNEVTRAMYLMPHLVNILREMHATPAARRGVIAAAPTTPSGLGQLSAVPRPA